MRVLVVSNIFIIRESVVSIFNKNFQIDRIDSLSDIKDIDDSILRDYDLIFFQGNDKVEDLELVLEICGSGTKLIVLDLQKNEKQFIKSIKSGVDGYILSIDDEYDFKYIVNQVISGRKHYDSNIIYSVINSKNMKENSELTRREVEIMREVSKGLNNRDISNTLNIAECTVKKHVSSILDKLSLRSRKDIILHSLNSD